MDQQQAQQQPDDQQPVQWGPDRRTGKILDEFPLHGEVWCVVQSDEWHERRDLRDADQRYYQREATKQTTPCLLTIRKRDLQPAAPAQQKPATAGLREDVAAALQAVRDMQQVAALAAPPPVRASHVVKFSAKQTLKLADRMDAAPDLKQRRFTHAEVVDLLRVVGGDQDARERLGDLGQLLELGGAGEGEPAQRAAAGDGAEARA